MYLCTVICTVNDTHRMRMYAELQSRFITLLGRLSVRNCYNWYSAILAVHMESPWSDAWDQEEVLLLSFDHLNSINVYELYDGMQYTRIEWISVVVLHRVEGAYNRTYIHICTYSERANTVSCIHVAQFFWGRPVSKQHGTRQYMRKHWHSCASPL